MPSNQIITFGETMVRLSPPCRQRLETTDTLDFRVGGSESNTAIALTRLGWRVAWWSKLPDNPLGRRISSQVARWGVDVSRIHWAAQGRAGVYFIEYGAPPRQHEVTYDRAGSVASTICAEDLDGAILDGARHLHITGITVALSQSCASTVERAIFEARERGLTVSFDVNYRHKLWSPEAASCALSPLLSQVDLLLCPYADAATLFGITGDGEGVALELQQRFGCAAVAVTAGGDGAYAYDGRRSIFAPALPMQEVDRVGAGDAFDAGVIHGWLNGDLELGLRYGMAMAALKHTMPGDELVATRSEIDALVRGATHGIVR